MQSEDEALALALQASLSEVPTHSNPPSQSNKPLTAQEEEDLALAQALAQSERDEENRRRVGVDIFNIICLVHILLTQSTLLVIHRFYSTVVNTDLLTHTISCCQII